MPAAKIRTMHGELYRPRRYKVLYGGRGSGKTWAVAQALVLAAASRKLRITTAREFETTLDQSAKRTIELMIRRLGLAHRFDVRSRFIRGRNGSYFAFRGIERNRDSIRGWEDVDIVWCEEAQRLSQETWEILIPTIRKDGSEIWVTFNPVSRSDVVWRTFCTGSPPDDAFVRKVNFLDLPESIRSAELEAERRRCLRDEPERYRHIWLGEPDDEGAARHVLPFARLEEARTMWRPAYEEAIPFAGFDVSDTGDDWNSLTVRRGPVITRVERWQGTTTGQSTQRVHNACLEEGVRACYYDVGGVGAGARSEFMRIAPPYAALPVHFGGRVGGPDRLYSARVTNADFFRARNAQMAWALRIRAENTRKLAAGENIPPANCLFLRPDIPRIEHYMSELSQPTWNDDAGKIRIEKADEGEPSPDRFDSTGLAFALDSHAGLRAAA